jgi:uncharacterized protein YneF (UPF0154 family)
MNKTAFIVVLILVLLIGIVIGYYFQLTNSKQNPSKNKIITPEDLKTELKNLEKLDATKVNPNDYPKILGTYSENGQVLIESYFCSDVCPAYAGINIIFQNISSKEACDQINGNTLIDPAWGGFEGCAPIIE